LRIFLIALTSCAVATFFVGHARADLDQRWFVGNFIGYSAQPENYFSISGGIDRSQNFESVYLEKTISSESSLSLFAGYQRLEQEGESTAGWSNLTLAYKRILIAIPRREFVLSISPGVELPVGNRSVGSESHTRAGFDLLVEKGLVDLPDSLRMLRPAALEGDVGFDKKVSGAQDDRSPSAPSWNIRSPTSTSTSPAIDYRLPFAISRRISTLTTRNTSARIATRARPTSS
jgi:hypothetical protein